ncbi:hypothetical protein [Chitinimonas naiadis]
MAMHQLLKRTNSIDSSVNQRDKPVSAIQRMVDASPKQAAQRSHIAQLFSTDLPVQGVFTPHGNAALRGMADAALEAVVAELDGEGWRDGRPAAINRVAHACANRARNYEAAADQANAQKWWGLKSEAQRAYGYAKIAEDNGLDDVTPDVLGRVMEMGPRFAGGAGAGGGAAPPAAAVGVGAEAELDEKEAPVTKEDE